MHSREHVTDVSVLLFSVSFNLKKKEAGSEEEAVPYERRTRVKLLEKERREAQSWLCAGCPHVAFARSKLKGAPPTRRNAHTVTLKIAAFVPRRRQDGAATMKTGVASARPANQNQRRRLRGRTAAGAAASSRRLQR